MRGRGNVRHSLCQLYRRTFVPYRLNEKPMVIPSMRYGLDCATAKRQYTTDKGKGSPYSITERRVPELIPVLSSQLAGDVSHKPGDRLPLLSARPAVTLATLKRAATDFAAW